MCSYNFYTYPDHNLFQVSLCPGLLFRWTFSWCQTQSGSFSWFHNTTIAKITFWHMYYKIMLNSFLFCLNFGQIQLLACFQMTVRSLSIQPCIQNFQDYTEKLKVRMGMEKKECWARSNRISSTTPVLLLGWSNELPKFIGWS